MIPGPPTMSGKCFFTNHRSFSSSRGAEAKLFTAFTLRVNGASATVMGEANGSATHATGPSTRVTCDTGGDREVRSGPLRVDALGGPHSAGGRHQVILQAAAANPFAPAGISPSIDYSLDLIYDASTKTLTYNGSIGKFPAYEAYASLNGGDVKRLFRQSPTGATAWALYDFGTGIGDRTVSGEVKFVTVSRLVGSWAGTFDGDRVGLTFATGAGGYSGEIHGDGERFPLQDVQLGDRDGSFSFQLEPGVTASCTVQMTANGQQLRLTITSGGETQSVTMQRGG